LFGLGDGGRRVAGVPFAPAALQFFDICSDPLSLAGIVVASQVEVFVVAWGFDLGTDYGELDFLLFADRVEVYRFAVRRVLGDFAVGNGLFF
jgi:hypothetical protein